MDVPPSFYTVAMKLHFQMAVKIGSCHLSLPRFDLPLTASLRAFDQFDCGAF